MNKAKRFLSKAVFPMVALVLITGMLLIHFSFTIMRIETDSMEPTLPVGTWVFIGHGDSYKPGDIISFQQSTMTRPTTHRFIGYDAQGRIKTEGDANSALDVWSLQKSDVIGKVAFSAKIFAPSYWTSVQGVLVLSIVVLALVAISIVLVMARSKGRKEAEGLLQDNEQKQLETNPV